MLNETPMPSLADRAAANGLDLVPHTDAMERAIDDSAIGMACVELISRMENRFVKVRQKSRTDYIDESGEMARELLELLECFCKAFLDGAAARQSIDEITKAHMCSHAYDEILKRRPIGNALLRAFWKADEVDDVKQAHVSLGESLVRATTTTLYHSVMMLGVDTELGQEIDQGTVVFVIELQDNWPA